MSDLDQAIKNFPVRSWLSEHTNVRDGGGRNLYADCPECHGKHKLRIRKDTGKFKCFKCDEGGYGGVNWRGWGSIFQLVAHFEKSTFGQAVRLVVERSGVPDIQLTREGAPLQKIPREAISLLEIPEDHRANRRLRERGLYHLREKLYACFSGKYAERWILPCHFRGDVHGIEAKGILGATEPKTLYPDWFVSTDYIYTTYEWRDSLPFVIVTESIFDAETFGLNAVGIYGSQLLPSQFDWLLKLRQKGVDSLFWALDPDAWSRQAQAIVQKTSAQFRNYVLEIPATLHNGSKGDPNGIGHVACWELVEKAKQIESEWDLMETSARDL